MKSDHGRERAPSSAEPAVALHGVRKVYYPSPGWMRMLVRSNIQRPIVALDGIDFRLEPGDITALVGPNGAGKTTIFRILVGLTTATGGRATVMGLDAGRQANAVRQIIGWMPAEERSLFMRQDCRQNLDFHGRLQGMSRLDRERRIAEVAELVGLSERLDSTVFSLSAGMRARLQLARALLHRPQVLVLDEPTGAVDPVAAHRLLELIVEVIRHERLAALISSHRLEEIEALHSRVLLLDRGRVRYQGDLDELKAVWRRPDIEISFPNEETASLAADAMTRAGYVFSNGGTQLRCSGPAGITTGRLLVDLGPLTAQILSVREQTPPLREMLADLYGDTGPERGPGGKGREPRGSERMGRRRAAR